MVKTRVMVAEHCPVFREGLYRVINEENQLELVGMTGDCVEAVKLAKELIPDVVIVDADLAKFDGIEVARQIKKACPQIAILMLSTLDWEANVLAAVRLGASGYLLKDTEIRELTNAVRAVHVGEVIFDKKAASHILRRIDRVSGVDRKGFKELHHREIEILNLTAMGKRNREISKELSISERTVQTHLVNIFRKLGVTSRTEAAVHALKEGLVQADEER